MGLRVEIWRQPTGGIFALYQKMETTINSDALGNYLSSEQSVPNDSGYITQAKNCSVFQL
jgi:hypothetical protein